MFTVTADTPTLEAFSMLARDHKSALGVTDPASGKLIGNLSVSDIRGLKAEDFPQLLLPVGDYILVRHGKAPAVRPAGGKGAGGVWLQSTCMDAAALGCTAGIGGSPGLMRTAVAWGYSHWYVYIVVLQEQLTGLS